MGFLNKLFSKKLDLQSKHASSIYTFYINDIFTIKRVGCIVFGIVKGSDIRVGDDVYIIDVNGNRLPSKVMSMENPRVGEMNIAPVGSNVGILLSDIEAKQLHRGDILTNEKKIN
ncbi:hypothetical protein [Tepidibacter hydrothermalis]|uniref:Uncharacterized protein n=1 Tax=Tepidibacter hydrothermalis TaxID=3036126 RepID=A0ABY8EG67_9FIRM|nr:hypothetical protein [Tepidibacter hydrothermalis]WFD11946.1 hypothetical protein P4S50_07680 [Tepidibacter hydrothermalis]